MNRPPKKKKQRKDGLVEDPRFDRDELEHAGSSKTPAHSAEGDDRNLVDIDEAFAEADFEDRMWLFWQNNKAGIIAAITIAVLGVVGINTWRMIQENQRVAMQTEYSSAAGDAAKLESFGAANGESMLGGLALLEAADAQYEAGEFAQAASLYQQSLLPLQESVVVYRARLGLAVSQLKAGQAAEGKGTLRSLLDSPSALASIRAEAGVELAQLELAEGNRDAAAQLLQRVQGLPYAEYWKARAAALIQMEKLGAEGV